MFPIRFETLSGAFAIPFAALLLRYLLFAGTAYLIFYVWKKSSLEHLKIQKKFPGKIQLISEVKYSLSTLCIFTISAAFVIYGSRLGWFIPWTLGTGPVDCMVDFGLLVLVHDAWFYWTHRLMHHKSIFRYVHAVHHRSTNPTPWAAFAFHPLEAVIEAGFVPLVFSVTQIHFFAFFGFMTWMIVFNVLGHLGFEVFPWKWFFTKVGRWQNSGTHHNMHHQYSNGNYGLYFNFWDKVMGTNHPDYKKRLSEKTGSAFYTAPSRRKLLKKIY